MDDDLTELQRQVLALLPTVRSRSTRYRLCEIHERLMKLVRPERGESLPSAATRARGQARRSSAA
jgi:hypothetical protein